MIPNQSLQRQIGHNASFTMLRLHINALPRNLDIISFAENATVSDRLWQMQFFCSGKAATVTNDVSAYYISKIALGNLGYLLRLAGGHRHSHEPAPPPPTASARGRHVGGTWAARTQNVEHHLQTCLRLIQHTMWWNFWNRREFAELNRIHQLK